MVTKHVTFDNELGHIFADRWLCLHENGGSFPKPKKLERKETREKSGMSTLQKGAIWIQYK